MAHTQRQGWPESVGYRLVVGFEATGGYERKLAALLDRLGLSAYLLDPAQVRSFARAERQLAKTDPLDAAVIALSRRAPPRPHSLPA